MSERKMKKHWKRRVLAVGMSMAMAVSILPTGSLTESKAAVTEEEVVVDATQNDAGNYELQSDIQGSNILHCWNWSYATIEAHLPLIAECGYTAIQTSPAQQPKDYNYSYEDEDTGEIITETGDSLIGGAVGWPKKSGSGNWWKVYQPVTFDVCDNGNSWMGTKEELKSLCATAEQYGIKVIVDVVANHMGNITGWKNSLSDVSPQVGEYWNKEMLTDESYWHINDGVYVHSSDSRYHFTQGCMGMPDLNTADSRVQGYVADYLDECIDCGVDGFRFDAAKHIETPDDGQYASDFWPNVLGEATSYYKSKTGGNLYVYGEILNTVGLDFSIDSYTKYMSVTDNSAGNQVLSSIRFGSPASVNLNYAANKSVLWAESHDTYMNESSSLAPDVATVRTWAMVGNKKDAASLFFVRPYYSSQVLTNDQNDSFNNSFYNEPSARMGECSTYVWASKEVAAINHFNNRFASSADSTGTDGNIAYCKRGDGIILANFGEGYSSSCSISVSSHGLADGTYTDEVSGNTFKVSGGTLTGNMDSEYGIAVIYKNVMSNPTTKYPISVDKPQILATMGTGSIVGEKEITYTVKNATSATYSIDGATEKSFDGSVTLTIGTGLSVGDSCTVKITAKNDDGTVTQTYTYTISENKPILSISPEDGETFSDELDVTVTAENTEKATYKVGSGKEVEFTGIQTITIGEDMEDGEEVVVTVYGKSSNGKEDTISATYTKEELDTSTYVYFKNTKGWSKVYCYAWNGESDSNAGWPGAEMTLYDKENNIYALDIGTTYKNVIFNNNAEQTDDLAFGGLGYMYDMGTNEWSLYESVKPKIKASTGTGTIEKAIEVTYTVTDAESATYAVDGGKEVSFKDSVKLTVGEDLKDGEKQTVVITAINGNKTATKTFTYTMKASSEEDEEKTLSDVSVTNYEDMYDGEKHSMSVSAPTGSKVSYGTEKDNYSLEEAPSYEEPGEYTVYFKVTKDGYKDYTGKGTVTIYAAKVTTGDSEKNYTTFEGAAAYANISGSKATITLYADAKVTENITLNSDVTVTTKNGATLVIDKGTILQGGILAGKVENNGTLVNVTITEEAQVTGDGTIEEKEVEETATPTATTKVQVTASATVKETATPTASSQVNPSGKETPVPSNNANQADGQVTNAPTQTPIVSSGELTITSMSLNPALSQVAGKDVKVTVAVSGGVANYTFSMKVYDDSDKEVAAYAETVSNNRVVFNWTPKTTGNFRVEMTVTDAAGAKISSSKGIVIVAKKLTALSLKASKKTIKKGKRITFTAKASGGKKSYKYRFIVYNAAGKKVKSSGYKSKNTFVWKTTKKGTYKVTLTVKDATGSTATKTIKKIRVK